MRTATIALLVLLLSCRMGGRETLSGVTPEPMEGLFDRAAQTLVSMGYAIQNANESAGFIVAEQQRESWNFGQNIDVIRVSFADAGEETNFTVTASTDVVPLTGQRRSDRPSDEVKSDAQELQVALSGS